MKITEKVPKSWLIDNLKEVPIVLRDDGFSQFFVVDGMDKHLLEKRCIDYLSKTKVKVKEWGLGPGSVFTFDTKVGEVFGTKLDEKQLNMLREGDRWVHSNVTGMISAGDDPLKVVVKKGHEIGLKVWARLEMNHEYAPADENNWMWVGLVGEFNKKHPEYRIPNSVNLDFKYEEVREFKISILREAALKGIDGISMDFAVYPPFLSDPDRDFHIITDFIARVREMTTEVSKITNRKIYIIVRVPINYDSIGLHWRDWISKKLIDIIIPTVVRLKDEFDVSIDEFIEAAKDTECKVYGCVRPYLGYINSDPIPEDDKTHVTRYDRDMTVEMFHAKAFLLLRAGVNGLQIATGSGDYGSKSDDWKKKTDAWKSVYNDLGSPEMLMYKDKDYVINRKGQFPMVLTTGENIKYAKVRIADDIQKLLTENCRMHMNIVLFCRVLSTDEILSLYINDNGPLHLTQDAFDKIDNDAPIEIISGKKNPSDHVFYDKNWWKKGMHEFIVPIEWFVLGENDIKILYNCNNSDKNEFRITDMDLKIYFD